jgi:hypothetical protein
MKRSSLLVVAVVLLAGCVFRQGAGANPGPQTRTAAAESATPATVINVDDTRQKTGGEGGGVPTEWQGVDFKNFSYPVSWGRRAFKLDGGEFEYYRDKGFDGGNGWFSLKDVHYADLTGDAKAEAIVSVSQVTCGGSCDGGAYLIYFYSAGGRRPRLLWRLETGSLSYGCGLKSLLVKGGAITVETFKKCSFDGGSFVGGDELEPGEPHQKFASKSFTRFLFEFDGRRFALKGREVFPNPQENIMNHSPTVSISDE